MQKSSRIVTTITGLLYILLIQEKTHITKHNPNIPQVSGNLPEMKKLFAATTLATLMSTSAMAETIGVSMALFDDNFLTVLRNGMIEQAEAMDGVEVFHAGTVCNGDGRWLTNGGRVVGVTASGADVKTATALAYQAVSKISWKDVHYRRDIAQRAIERAANGE